jgi:AcrR family transcriptional regulator
MLIQQARVSTTAFYARFGSKAEVLIAIAERFFKSLHDAAAKSIVGARSVEEGIELGIRALCKHLEGRQALVRLLIAEAGMSVPTLATRRASYGQLVAFLAERVRYLSERKRIATVADPEHFAWAVVGALEMQVVRWAVWDEIDHLEMRHALLRTAHVIMPPELEPR